MNIVKLVEFAAAPAGAVFIYLRNSIWCAMVKIGSIKTGCVVQKAIAVSPVASAVVVGYENDLCTICWGRGSGHPQYMRSDIHVSQQQDAAGRFKCEIIGRASAVRVLPICDCS